VGRANMIYDAVGNGLYKHLAEEMARQRETDLADQTWRCLEAPVTQDAKIGNIFETYATLLLLRGDWKGIATMLYMLASLDGDGLAPQTMPPADGGGGDDPAAGGNAIPAPVALGAPAAPDAPVAPAAPATPAIPGGSDASLAPAAHVVLVVPEDPFAPLVQVASANAGCDGTRQCACAPRYARKARQAAAQPGQDQDRDGAPKGKGKAAKGGEAAADVRPNPTGDARPGMARGYFAEAGAGAGDAAKSNIFPARTKTQINIEHESLLMVLQMIPVCEINTHPACGTHPTRPTPFMSMFTSMRTSSAFGV